MSNQYQFTFKGKGGDFFIIFLKNIFLTIVTLGVYKFWAQVEVNKFLYRNTEFSNSPFDFHGTGKEKFMGFLKAMLIIVPGIIGYAMLSTLLVSVFGPQVGQVISIILLYGTILALQPLIMIGSKRYALSRTSWHQIRFSFHGKYKDLVLIMVKGAFLTGITFGIYSAWFFNELNHFNVNHSKFGNKSFRYKGDGSEYFKVFFLGYLLTIITFGIYSFKWRADLDRYYYKNLEFGEGSFKSEITGFELFKNDIVVFAMIIFSLGLAMPWAMVKSLQFQFSMLSFNGNPGLEEVFAYMDEKSSALADGLADSGEAIDTVGDFVGV